MFAAWCILGPSMVAEPTGDPSQRARWAETSDAELVNAARTDVAAFDALYRRYLPAVYRFALAELGSVADAEDVTAAVFLAVLTSLPRYREQGCFAAWLFTIARRQVRDARRRSGRRASWPEAETVAASPERTVDTGSQESGLEERLLLRRALAQLTPERREAIALRFYAGLPITEIARLTGRGESAVKMLLHRGLEQLRRLLAEEGDG